LADPLDEGRTAYPLEVVEGRSALDGKAFLFAEGDFGRDVADVPCHRRHRSWTGSSRPCGGTAAMLECFEQCRA